MRFSYKIFKVGGNVLLAIADVSIIGKEYSEGDLQIEVKKDFYSEKTCSERDVTRLVNDATIVNAVGKDIISFLIRNKVIDKDNVLYISGIPHAQVVIIK